MNSEQNCLADPEDKPGSPVVVWDGQCDFCRSQVERLSRFDSQDSLSYLSLHDPRIKDICANLTHEQLMEQMWVCTPEGEQHGGADAIRFLSGILPRLKWLKPLMMIPGAMPVARRLYAWVAKRRYKISGRNCDTGSCDLH